ncbi:DUF3888 domain-containing protein [Brevibacillus agri]|uniref:DUF3888 domain-containing protein n=1 Tax=Brevibacillus TaxID=55080 RepID=UPI000685053D|nr:MULTISPECIES: DUF3888 domain-containing protein [Brevibacillus]MCG5252950.1 DUF3888 domain-containing protein [Brevibacillus agri]MDN4095604.1 DUF3888 domain-containing protein [Brevibacillus agri]QHZ58441.1 DUF3888 domain-containing protein [Brevibacillus sp. NSP2.1]
MSKVYQLLLSLMFFHIFTYNGVNAAHHVSSSNQTDSVLYQDVILTLLSPQIEKEVHQYYSKLLTEPPTFSPYYGTEMTIDRPGGYRTSQFIVKVKVTPYVGPHIAVGEDLITFSINGGGQVKVLGYKHLEDHKLPPHWKHIKRQ